MKLFLFGGAESSLGQVAPLRRLIKEAILSVQPASVLHIPFARTNIHDPDWEVGWFEKMMEDTGIAVLDANNPADLEKASESAIYINGGLNKSNLMEAFDTNKTLRNIVLYAKFCVAESAGALAFGEYLRSSRETLTLINGLGILKDTIIEAHYSELNRHDLLVSEMQQKDLKYGIGIDCATGIVVDPEKFPDNWEKVGNGKVEIITAN